MKTVTSFLMVLVASVFSLSHAQDAPSHVSKSISNLDVTGGKIVFFDFDSGAAVDSSSGWEIQLNGSQIQVNGSLAIVEKKFESVFAAPSTDSFITDDSGITSFPSGSDAGWFMYDSSTHTVEAVPQRTFVIKNSDGNYSKLQIFSYYKDAESADTPGAEPRYYSFRYKMNTVGSTKL